MDVYYIWITNERLFMTDEQLEFTEDLIRISKKLDDKIQKEVYWINREYAHLDPKAFYMNLVSGEVDTGADWATDYFTYRKQGGVLTFKEWCPIPLREVVLDEYGSWVEA